MGFGKMFDCIPYVLVQNIQKYAFTSDFFYNTVFGVIF